MRSTLLVISGILLLVQMTSVNGEPIDIEKTTVFQIDKRLSGETDKGGFYHAYVNTRDKRCCKVKITIQADAAPIIDSQCCNPGRCSGANLC